MTVASPPSIRADRAAPELLSPAGDWDAMRAAVANGADAVYFGLSDFNARHRAANFTPEELPEVMRFLHDRNVRGYVTFNTLIFTDELEHAAKLIARMAESGVDAIIVQDFGIASLAHAMAPSLPIHGSTQMTLTEPRGIEFVKSLGVQRVILARELSTADIARAAAGTDMPLEVFVHGALCVAYSGQCLTSESIGGRSANRGQCAQSCRLPYEMFVDGEPRDLGDRAYLLSPQDLAAPDLIGELTGIGVACFKIEGRLKSAQYVAGTTQTYRAALDAALAGRTFKLTHEQELDLAQSFSRGLTHGFLDGNDHQKLVHGRFPKSRGVKLGKVSAKTDRGVVIVPEVAAAVKPGDGIVFDEGHPEQDEQGGRVYAVERGPRGSIELVLGRGAVNLGAIEIGAVVWKTDDPALRKRLERSYASDKPARRATVAFEVQARIGGRLNLTAVDPAGRRAEAEWDRPLEAALRHPLSIELLREQLGRLGDTPFELGEVRADAIDPVMVPKSVLNDLRRQVIDKLAAARSTDAGHAVAASDALTELRRRAAVGSVDSSTSAPIHPSSFILHPSVPTLHVLARSMDQLEAVLAWQSSDGLPKPATVYCDFEDVRRYREAVQRARAAGVRIGLGSIRVVKPGEEGLLKQTLACEPDVLLVRNLAALGVARELAPHLELVGDFALNIANELTADIFRGAGLTRMVPSYDLNWEQLAAMVGRFDPAVFETVIHQHMPMFHMEHCVFAAFLSNGKDHRDCGRPCDRHRVELRDRVGAAHPVVADVGCRNTVYNSMAQTAAEFVPRMRELGLRHFRVELLRQSASEVAPLLDSYARVLAGTEDGRTTWRQLRLVNQLGVTRFGKW